ncbi:cyclase family protein [Peribacillus alkalitolerans]|uniref:cyclase family protein n=1 Tax=Peribacillus alkalitolerans TaxID=1550385 RepID=UPI0013D068B2|nr:cyclase family protein [Peribacillus alkalitolerans]
MKIYDVTAPIFKGMPVYKNKPEKQPEISTVTNAHVTESRISIDVHTGTHVDAPLHMMNEGSTIESLSIERLVRHAKVIDLKGVSDRITKEDIQDKGINKGDFILFKTKNSFDTEFNFEFIFVAHDAAEFLVEQGIEGVGIDALGIERAQEGHPTHRALMGQDIIIMEGLQLKEVPEGEYFMAALPLKLQDVDAAPARIVLIEGI